MDEAGARRGQDRRSQEVNVPGCAISPEREEQRKQLPELLARGADAYGSREEVWTCERVAEVILKEFGMSYHPAHVSWPVRELGLSLQKPMHRSNQQDEEAIKRWKEGRWPSLKKGP